MTRASIAAPALLVAAALALAAIAPSVAATPTTRSERYIGANPFLFATAQPISGANAWFGGTEFNATGQTPRFVNVTDDSGAPVYAIACQDLDFDGACGGAGEPSVDGCGARLDLATSAVPFNVTRPVGVLIFETDDGIRGPPTVPVHCGGIATQGLITLTSV